MPPAQPPYTPVLSEEQWAALESLPTTALREKAIDFLMTYAAFTPRRWMPNGALKELKGAYAGYWQFDLDRSHRLIYSINDEEMTIRVEYVGTHPQWGNRGGRIRN